MSILSFHSGFAILYLTKLTEQNELQKKKKKRLRSWQLNISY